MDHGDFDSKTSWFEKYHYVVPNLSKVVGKILLPLHKDNRK